MGVVAVGISGLDAEREVDAQVWRTLNGLQGSMGGLKSAFIGGISISGMTKSTLNFKKRVLSALKHFLEAHLDVIQHELLLSVVY